MGKVVVYLPAAFERWLKEQGHDPGEWLRAEVKELVAQRGQTVREPAHTNFDPHFKPDFKGK